jgi:hypothetical protein
MNEQDRIHFELRNDLAQAVAVEGRTLARQLQYVQNKISELARQACLEAGGGLDG